jgi:glutaredoxin-like YruB-family protein
MIKIYTTTYCPFCKLAKEFLLEHGFDFEEINVEEDEKGFEEMVRKSGQYGVPVIDVDGEIIIGFDRKRLKEVLKIE